MPDAHHLMGPSSLARRVACPGSLAVERLLPAPPSSAAADRGTRIHAYAATLIGNPAAERPAEADAEEWAAALRCLEYARPLLLNPGDLYIEHRLEYRAMDEVLYFGTCDVLLVDVANGTGIIVDWKTGGNPVPEADCNWQGAGYALAAMQMFNLHRVAVVFFNPGPLCKQETSCTWSDRDVLERAVLSIHRACEPPGAQLAMSNQCQYCAGAYWGVCPAVAGHRLAISNGQYAQGLESLTDAELGTAYEHCQICGSAADAVKKEIIRRCQLNGECGDYYVAGRAAPTIIPDPLRMAEDLGLSTSDLLEVVGLGTSHAAEVLARKLMWEDSAMTKTAALKAAKEMLAPYTSAPQTRTTLKRKR
jgi:hypothetical protein